MIHTIPGIGGRLHKCTIISTSQNQDLYEFLTYPIPHVDWILYSLQRTDFNLYLPRSFETHP